MRVLVGQTMGESSFSQVARWMAGRLADGVAEAAWPTRCVGCGLPGPLLCDECAHAMPWVEQRWACPSCGAPFGWLACTACCREWQGPPCVCATGFADVAAHVVTVLKDGHETRLAPVMAAAMACALDEAASWSGEDADPTFFSADAIAFVPATARAYARRGFDHMELVARSLSAFVGLPVADVLVRGPSLDQRELGRDDRALNLGGSVDVVDDVSGARILLVDDVVTTGASLSACADALDRAGTASVAACGFARVW